MAKRFPRHDVWLSFCREERSFIGKAKTKSLMRLRILKAEADLVPRDSVGWLRQCILILIHLHHLRLTAAPQWDSQRILMNNHFKLFQKSTKNKVWQYPFYFYLISKHFSVYKWLSSLHILFHQLLHLYQALSLPLKNSWYFSSFLNQIQDLEWLNPSRREMKISSYVSMLSNIKNSRM